MLAPALDTIRLTLHVLAATVWVGGQIVMMGLVGPARTLGGDAPQTLAARLRPHGLAGLRGPRRHRPLEHHHFHLVRPELGLEGRAVAKIVVVVLAGLGAFLHQRATTKGQLALWGSVAGTASVAALVMGVLLAG